MDGASPNAVFLSYAREDTVAVTAIAEALRGHGIEVWFDQEELRGGDAWDDKIRGQIKACTLFVPIISAHTNARLEGYFRREWKQAVERTHDMVDELTFLLPVVIDDTPEASARVPERFRRTQWMRVRNQTDEQALAQRVRALLGSPFAPTTPAQPARAAGAATPRKTERQLPLLVLLGVTVVVAIGAPLYLRHHRHFETPAAESGPATITTFPAAPKLRDAMRYLTGTDAIPEDFKLADDIAQEFCRQDPTNADAATVQTFVDGFFLLRGFDDSIERRAGALKFGERAVSLAESSAYAHGALGIALLYQSGFSQLSRAQSEFAAAIKLNPSEPYFYRMRDQALFGDPKVTTQDAMAASIDTAKRFPHDALAHYDLARHYRDVGAIADMEREIDLTLQITPIVNAIVWKARLALWVRGDPEEMQRVLRQIPERGRSLERAVIGHWIYAMATGKSDEALDALSALPQTWVTDFDYVGPKALLTGMLLNARGDRELAKLSLESALAEIKKWKSTQADAGMLAAEFWCLHDLGRDEEAAAQLKLQNQALLRPYRVGFGQSWWLSAIPANLIQGNRAFALTLLREAATRASEGAGQILQAARPIDVIRSGYPTSYRQMIREMMRVDPRMAPWRQDPEIKAILEASDTAPGDPNADRAGLYN